MVYQQEVLDTSMCQGLLKKEGLNNDVISRFYSYTINWWRLACSEHVFDHDHDCSAVSFYRSCIVLM